MPPKKKAKLAAFKSTGGKAPRKQLATRNYGLPGAAEREARAAANNKKKKKAKKGEREVYMLRVATFEIGSEQTEETTVEGLYASWDKCCEAAGDYMEENEDFGREPWYTQFQDEEYEPEIIYMVGAEKAAGPPLKVGDQVTLVKGTVGEQYERGYRTMRVFVESHILYE